MKKILSLAIAAGLLLTITAQAQFITAPGLFNAVTNAVYTNALTVASAATTNLPTSVARIITIGPSGFGVQVYCSAAGSSAATNTLAFEQSMDGSNFVATLPLIAVFVTNNSTAAITYNTNILNNTPSIGPNTRAIRLKYITNSIAQIGYYTNILISTGR